MAQKQESKRYFDILSEALAPFGLTHRYEGYESFDYAIDITSHSIKRPTKIFGIIPLFISKEVGKVVSEPRFQEDIHATSINFYHLVYNGLKIVFNEEKLSLYFPTLKNKLEEELGETVEICLQN